MGFPSSFVGFLAIYNYFLFSFGKLACASNSGFLLQIGRDFLCYYFVSTLFFVWKLTIFQSWFLFSFLFWLRKSIKKFVLADLNYTCPPFPYFGLAEGVRAGAKAAAVACIASAVPTVCEFYHFYLKKFCVLV